MNVTNNPTELILLTIADRRPENLLRFDADRLFAFVRDGRNAQDLRATVLAEIVARWCVSGDSGLESGLSAIIGDAWRGFSDWYNLNHQWTGMRFRPSELPGWKSQDCFLGFGDVLRRRLDRLFDANGFIPVFDDFGGTFIPFQLEESVDGAMWYDGTPIEVWNDPVRRALRGTDYRGIRIQLRPGPEMSVKGESLMLPVRMAALRGKPDGLPRYDVLRVLATGRFDDAFRLADVGLKLKVEAAKRQFRDAILFAPDVPGEASDCKWFHRLESGLDECAVLARIRETLERTPGCVKMSRDYALRRLPDMMAFVDRENHNRWNEVAGQLEQLKDALSARRDPETWLEFSSLLATAFCHAGRTDDSKRCANEAMSFARKHGYVAKALRLQVTAAVNAQDLGEIEEYDVLASGLERELTAFNGPEKADLLMRFHGTAAQANACGAVYGVTGLSVAAAKAHVEAAVGIAQKIADSVPEEGRDEAESNLAQDLNYRHLIFALFEPGSDVERSAFKDAQRQLNELSEKSRRNNLYFQLHQKTLALLNGWQRDGKKPDVDELPAWRLPLESEGWLVAANRRHLGALAAAANEADEAAKCFAEGDGALALTECWAPVLGSIRFALLVQAACSLAACGRKEESAQYADLAKETYATFGQSKLFGVIHAEKWMEALQGLADPRTLPAFYY